MKLIFRFCLSLHKAPNSSGILLVNKVYKFWSVEIIIKHVNNPYKYYINDIYKTNIL